MHNRASAIRHWLTHYSVAVVNIQPRFILLTNISTHCNMCDAVCALSRTHYFSRHYQLLSLLKTSWSLLLEEYSLQTIAFVFTLNNHFKRIDRFTIICLFYTWECCIGMPFCHLIVSGTIYLDYRAYGDKVPGHRLKLVDATRFNRQQNDTTNETC